MCTVLSSGGCWQIASACLVVSSVIAWQAYTDVAVQCQTLGDWQQREFCCRHLFFQHPFILFDWDSLSCSCSTLGLTCVRSLHLLSLTTCKLVGNQLLKYSLNVPSSLLIINQHALISDNPNMEFDNFNPLCPHHLTHSFSIPFAHTT